MQVHIKSLGSRHALQFRVRPKIMGSKTLINKIIFTVHKILGFRNRSFIIYTVFSLKFKTFQVIAKLSFYFGGACAN